MRRRAPLRTCVACRTERSKKDLVRLVRTADGRLLWDSSGKVSGRGAYLCRDVGCLDQALKRKAFERALGSAPGGEQLDEFRRLVSAGPALPSQPGELRSA